jgi:hypothetical protein
MMELFTALLTGFFFWLFTSRLQRNWRAHAYEVAGPLLLEVKLPAGCHWLLVSQCLE